MITCNTASSKDIKFNYPHWILFAQCAILSITAQIACEHFVVDEKVQILHFHDEDKPWWSSILYHRVANANHYLYILVLKLPQLVIVLSCKLLKPCNWKSIYIDPLLSLVIPRFLKTCCQNIASFKPIISYSTFTFTLIIHGCHS